MGYCPFCIVTEWLGSWAGRAGRRRGVGLGVRGALGWSAWGARQGRVAGVARRQGRWRAQAWAHRLAGVERAGGRQAQAAGARAGRWARARAGRSGAGWRQACGSRRADTAGNRGARAAGRGSRRGRARSVRGRAGWAAGAWPGRWARPGCAGWPWAVHSVHSACFWPGSTRYFLESNFFGHCS